MGALETCRAVETLEWSWDESQRSWWVGRMMGFNLPFPQKDERKEGASEEILSSHLKGKFVDWGRLKEGFI